MPDPLDTRIAEVWSEPLTDNERTLALEAWRRADRWASEPARRTSDARKWGNLVLAAYDGQLAALRNAREALREIADRSDSPTVRRIARAALAPEQTKGTA